MTPELKPCPFCGRMPSLRTLVHFVGHKVACTADDCFARPSTKWMTTEEEAKVVWNTRAPVRVTLPSKRTYGDNISYEAQAEHDAYNEALADCEYDLKAQGVEVEK